MVKKTKKTKKLKNSGSFYYEYFFEPDNVFVVFVFPFFPFLVCFLYRFMACSFL